MIASQQIKTLRLKHNYTQIYLANKLNISQKTYSNMESGKSKITLNNLIKLSKLYNISKTEFIELIKQTETKTTNTNREENLEMPNSDTLEGICSPLELINLYKERIDDLKVFLESKNKHIKLLESKIEQLKSH